MINYGDIWQYIFYNHDLDHFSGICGHVTFRWQQGSVEVELDWPHSIARPPNLPLDAKILEISLT